jgi:hypothetical protein
MVSQDIRKALENHCRTLGLPAVPALDAVIDALEGALGQEAKGRPGRQHILDAAYFARVEAIHYTIAHDDGVAYEDWEAPISCWRACRAPRKRRPASILPTAATRWPISPSWWKAPAHRALRAEKAAGGGAYHRAERLIQVRRNRLLSLNQGTDTAYVDNERVSDELHYARRMFADNGWPVIDVTRRSIEETAAAVINLLKERRAPKKPNWTPNEPDPCQQERIAPGHAGCRRRGASGHPRAGGRARDRGRHGGRRPGDVALALAGAKAQVRRSSRGGWCWAAIRWWWWRAAVSTSPPRAPMPPIICASFPGARCSCIPPPRLPAMGRWCGAMADVARLRVRVLSEAFIERYLEAEWPEVAGCVGVFRIEALGVHLFHSIDGNHFTVLGMPLLPVLEALRGHGELAP